MTSDRPVIQVSNLVKQFGSLAAVNNVSLEVNPGEIYALLGPNGAGKSTTLNCILGFLNPDQGSIEVGGYNTITHTAEARSQLAYIPEQVALYPQLTGYENLDYLSQLSGAVRSDAALLHILERVKLPPHATHKAIATYSKGMRQKVGIAVALAKNARALILDEPTSGLDPSASFEFSQLIKQLAAQGTAILMATHDLFRAQEDAHKVAIFHNGKIVRAITDESMGNIDLERMYLQHVVEEATC